VPVISSPQDFNDDQVYVDLKSIFGRQLFLRREAFNFTGSIKLKASKEMVESAEQDGCLGPGSVLVESPSGNLGVARRCALHVRLGLRMIAASKGHEFIGVTDSRCNLTTSRLMEALGARVHTIIEPDPHGGFLEARINYVRALCASDERYVWPVRIVAVDSMGSVTFGGAPGPRIFPAWARVLVRRNSTSHSWTRCCSSRRPTPCVPAAGWHAAGSCSAAAPAPW
jgi:hypothetical protein